MKMNRNTFSVVADIDVEESMFFKIQNFLQAISFFFSVLLLKLTLMIWGLSKSM